jgi:hypothetical protein
LAGSNYVLQRVVTALARGGAVMTNNGVELVKKPRQ